MNNNDRSQWINNDEGLYNWWKSSRMSMTKFIKEIDEAITNALKPKQEYGLGYMQGLGAS